MKERKFGFGTSKVVTYLFLFSLAPSLATAATVDRNIDHTVLAILCSCFIMTLVGKASILRMSESAFGNAPISYSDYPQSELLDAR